jgi:superfamily II DNA helicase RecQ
LFGKRKGHLNITVRESTNRPNIRYVVRREYGPNSLVESAAAFVRSYRNEHPSLFSHSRVKMIVYCRTKNMVAELAEILGCASFTADSGSDQG